MLTYYDLQSCTRSQHFCVKIILNLDLIEYRSLFLTRCKCRLYINLQGYRAQRGLIWYLKYKHNKVNKPNKSKPQKEYKFRRRDIYLQRLIVVRIGIRRNSHWKSRLSVRCSRARLDRVWRLHKKLSLIKHSGKDKEHLPNQSLS